MSTLGKVCLSISLLLWLLVLLPFIPAPYGGFAPRLLVAQNQWAERLRDTRADAIAASEKVVAARNELNKATADIKATTVGWDRFWTIPARGSGAANAATIAKQQGTLRLTNLGSADGLVEQEIDDGSGGKKFARPVIHAFYGGQSGYTYAGEFVAENITATGATLRPVHPVNPQLFQQWDVNAAWRLRTMIPPDDRTLIDGLFDQGKQVGERLARMNTNIQRQNGLKAEATRTLAIREGELLGNAANTAIPNRPEYRDGLLMVTEKTEEERNQLALEVDTLRRRILEAKAERERLLGEAGLVASQLPAPAKDGSGNKSQIARDENASAR